jgi:hypothetical protein
MKCGLKLDVEVGLKFAQERKRGILGLLFFPKTRNWQLVAVLFL